MDFHRNSGGSPVSSTSSTDPKHLNNHRNGSRHDTDTTTATNNSDPMHSWWESISKARSRIHLLSTILPDHTTANDPSISSLADSDRPARSLLSSVNAYGSVSSSLSYPASGSGEDPLCHWLYDTFLSSDPDLRLVVLSFIPILAGTYLSRIHSLSSVASPSLAGFEAVLLALYSSETKARAGKPILITIPDLSQPSLYHTPRVNSNTKQSPNSTKSNQSRPLIGVLSAPLEPQIAIKSTKRACIVGVALDCYYKQISQMPSWSKLDFCKFASDWAGQNCPCNSDMDQVTETNSFSSGIHVEEVEHDEIVEEILTLAITGGNSEELQSHLKGSRIPLPWELLQPVLRILGHCLLAPLNTNDVKDAASLAVRSLYARATHDLEPQAILATRSLIQLDRRSREALQNAAAVANVPSSANTPTKAQLIATMCDLKSLHWIGVRLEHLDSQRCNLVLGYSIHQAGPTGEMVSLRK